MRSEQLDTVPEELLSTRVIVPEELLSVGGIVKQEVEDNDETLCNEETESVFVDTSSTESENEFTRNEYFDALDSSVVSFIQKNKLCNLI